MRPLHSLWVRISSNPAERSLETSSIMGRTACKVTSWLCTRRGAFVVPDEPVTAFCQNAWGV